MKPDSAFPQIEVAVLVVERATRYLAEYNPNWKTFTLPMTQLKRHVRDGQRTREKPEEGALRVAAVALGRPLPPHALPRRLELDMPAHLLNRSGRDGQTKYYTYRMFGVRVSEPQVRHALGRHMIWMERDQFLTQQPVSPTAVFIWERLGDDHLRQQLEGYPSL